MKNKPNWLQWTTGILVLLALLFSYGAYTKDLTVTSNNIDYGKIQSIVSQEISNIQVDTPTAEEIVSAMGETDNEKIAEIYNEIFKEDRIEEKAKDLVLLEIETKKFKKDLINFLEEEIEEIKDVDYKDVKQISVRDIDVVVDGENAEVTTELKVTINNYGDEDETEKARVEVTFNVEELDPDENFEDAEVEDWSNFELTRFYN